MSDVALEFDASDYGEPDQDFLADQMAGEPADINAIIANIHNPNIAADLTDEQLATIGAKVCEEYEIDLASRKENGWEERNERALKLAKQVREQKDYPWPNAANVKYPLVATAAIQFNARAYPAIVDGAGVVKCKVLGKPSEEKTARADRVSRHMSWQLLEQMDGWEEDTDRLLIVLPISGTAFRKTYFDTGTGKNCSRLILADKLVVDYWAKDLQSVPRITEVCEFYPNEIEERKRSGVWIKAELGQVVDAANDDQAAHEFLEQHRLLDLDEDGYFEPYIVTVHKETRKVVRIVARYDENGVDINEQGEVVRIEPVHYYTKYGFVPAMDGSFYDVGFGHLLDDINQTVNSTLNQLLDAGHLSNTQGGFIGAGVSMKSGALRFKPGEWKRLEVSGQSLKENLVSLPVSQPSAVLFNLLGMLIEAARELTATQDILTGDTGNSNQPVGTTLAMIEQGLKVFSAIYKRIHRALKHELKLLYRLNRVYARPEEYFVFQDQEGVAQQADYAADDLDVLPVSDPTVVSDMQRIGRAQYLMQFRQDPLMNGEEINKRALEAANIPDIPALFAPKPQGPPPEMLEMMAKIEAQKRELDLREADATARNTKLYADVLAVLSNLGKSQVKNPDGTTQTVDGGVDPMVPALAEQLHGLAKQEAADGQVQPGNPVGMAGGAPNEAVPPIPEGPAGVPGEAMGGGGAPIAGPADEGAAPGGIG